MFEKFAFPWPLGQDPSEEDNLQVRLISAAARQLVEDRIGRLNPGNLPAAALRERTLTELYNQYPMWLELAHHNLDNAVLDAYGWPYDITDGEILARLLTLNHERAGLA